MASEIKAGQTIKVTIQKTVAREGARKTLERVFMTDKNVCKGVEVRSRNFVEQPKRRGGCIWTKRPNKLHLPLKPGDSATLTATPQMVKDLASVASYVEVAAQ